MTTFFFFFVCIFRFFAYANLIVCAFTILSLFVAFILGNKAVDPTYYFYMFLHDLVTFMLYNSFSWILILIIKTFFFKSDKHLMKKNWQIISVLLMAGCAAATAVGYVGKYGNSHAGWTAICGYFAKFCNRATAASSLSYFALFFYLILTVISANKSRQIQVWWRK